MNRKLLMIVSSLVAIGLCLLSMYASYLIYPNAFRVGIVVVVSEFFVILFMNHHENN